MGPSGQETEVRKIVLLNPKGGSGKTTISTNLAAYFAARGTAAALMDYDPQGSSVRWLSKRPEERPYVHGIDASRISMGATRSWQLRVPPATRYRIVDSPAAIPPQKLVEYTRDADSVLVPVGPSDIDIHAATKFIADLLLIAKVDRRAGRVGVIANRVREGTISYRNLMRFVRRLAIPMVAVLRDSQNYVHASEAGVGIHELQPWRVRKDVKEWEPLIQWLESRTPLSPADLRPNLTAVATPVGEMAEDLPAPLRPVTVL